MTTRTPPRRGPSDGPRMIPTIRSLASPDALAELIGREYGLHVVSCVLLRSLNNDVYEVTAAARRYAFKVYGPGGRSAAEVVWEQELIVHLTDAGVPVATVVPLADGRLVGSLPTAEGPRPFAMTAFVAGEKPREPYDDGLYRDLGRLVARFHRASDDFDSHRPRRPLDLPALLDGPLALVLPRLARVPDDRARVEALGTEARRRVEELTSQGLEWGIRHGDVGTDNVHRTRDGLVLHDFDLAAPGWRVADLTGVRATDHWDAFQDGYRSIRPLTEVDLAALPWLGVIERIANLAFHLVDKPALRGTESLADGWVERELTALREAARTLE